MTLNSQSPKSDKSVTTWYLYILRTSSGSLYTGITTDPERRLFEHESGKGAKSLRGKGPFVRELCAAVADRSAALSLEARIKKMKKSEKEALIRGESAVPGLGIDDHSID